MAQADENGPSTDSFAQDSHAKVDFIKVLKNSRLKESILNYIRKGQDFPAMSATAAVIIDLTTASDTSTTELANIILKDYGLTSKIVKLVNTVYFKRFGEVTTISRAILLLGFENIKNMVISMSLFDKMLKTGSHYLADLLSKAIYAAVVGQQIAAKIKYHSTEEAFLCSLFYCLGEILTSHYVPDKYAEIRDLMESDTGSDNLTPMVNDLYRDIGKEIASEWGFPGRVVLCMERINESITQGTNDLDRLRCVSAIANKIADITEKEPDRNKKKQQIQEMFVMFGSQYTELKTSIDEIAETSMQNLDKYCYAYGINFQKSSIGEQLAELPSEKAPSSKEEMIDELQSDFSAHMMGTQRDAEEMQDPETIFSFGMRDITRAMLDNHEMEDIFRIIIETIYRGLRTAGISRTLLLIKNTTKPMMDVRIAMGDSTVSLRKWFLVSIAPEEEDIFNISIQRQKDLLIKDSDSPWAKKLLPGWLRKTIAEPAYVMVLPTTVKGKTIGIIYIEGEREKLKNMLPAHFNYIKTLHDQAVLAIRKKSGI